METFAVARWIWGTLTADAALSAIVGSGVYDGVRKAGSALPCVVFQLQAPGNDFMTMNGVRIWNSSLWLVRGIAEQSSYGGQLLTIAYRIEALLHGQKGSNSDGVIYTCVRERPFQLREQPKEGTEYRHLGGLYRIQAR